jgi:hypothetical protein
MHSLQLKNILTKTSKAKKSYEKFPWSSSLNQAGKGLVHVHKKIGGYRQKGDKGMKIYAVSVPKTTAIQSGKYNDEKSLGALRELTEMSGLFCA